MTKPVFAGSLAQNYDAWFMTPAGRYAAELEIDLLQRLMPGTSGRVVLDVGCGTGIHLLEFAGSARLGVGVDISRDMLALAKVKAQDQGTDNLRFVLADAHALPFRRGVFDVVLWITALEFFSDPVRALAEGRGVGKGEGILAVLNKWSVSSTWRRILSWFRPSVFRAAWFYSPRALRKLALAAFGESLRFHGRTTMITFPFVPRWLQPFLRALDRIIERWRSPFGVFLAARLQWL